MLARYGNANSRLSGLILNPLQTRCRRLAIRKASLHWATYEASSIQSSFSRIASMRGFVMTTSSSSSSDGSDWVSVVLIRSTMGLEKQGKEGEEVGDRRRGRKPRFLLGLQRVVVQQAPSQFPLSKSELPVEYLLKVLPWN